MFTSKKVKDLETKMAVMQHTIDYLSWDGVVTSTNRYTGNPYPECLRAIEELSRKYEGMADWGVQQTRNIVDLRSAFILGGGFKVTPKEGKEKSSVRETEFINQFLELNDLNEELPLELAKEAELEGRTLLRLVPDLNTRQISLRHISYSSTKYKVVTDENDYKKYVEVTIGEGATSYKENTFVYKKFAGRLNKVNELMPKVATVLSAIENLDKALKDWRTINKLYASPTPYFKCETKEDSKSFYNRLKEIKWNIGKFIAGVADFKLVTPDNNGGTDSLEKEITVCMKIISGQTGVPVHFLGLPDLMSNRSTSTDLFELINASTAKERKVWLGAFDEVIKKTLQMANDTFQSGFDTECLKVDIPFTSTSKLKELVDVWLPLFESDVIDLSTFIAKIPDVNPKVMEDKLKREKQESLNLTMNQLKIKQTETQMKGEDNNE